jgi:hypothetical protein
MWCKKCSGRVFIDRVFSQKLHIEVYCLMCGKRWMINKESSAFGKWINKKEEQHKKTYGISS